MDEQNQKRARSETQSGTKNGPGGKEREREKGGKKMLVEKCREIVIQH